MSLLFPCCPSALKVKCLAFTLHRHLFLKHDYLVISQRLKKKLSRIILSSYLLFPTAALLHGMMQHVNGKANVTSHPSPHCSQKYQSPLSQHKPKQSVPFIYQWPVGGAAMKCSTSQFLTDFVEPEGQQMKDGESY